MVRKLLLLSLLLAGCAKGPQADLPSIGEARSLAAEWALLNEQASEGKLSKAYVASMHGWLRDQIEADATALAEPNSTYAIEMRALLRLPDGASVQRLRSHADRLKRIEVSLESA